MFISFLNLSEPPYISTHLSWQLGLTTITTREKIISDLKHIPQYVVLEHWDVNKTKFDKGTSGILFDKVKLDEDTKRYIVLADNESEESESESESEHEEEESMSIDKLILISMIIFAFYHFVHNIGRPSACTILSTCCTLNISNKKHDSVILGSNVWFTLLICPSLHLFQNLQPFFPHFLLQCNKHCIFFFCPDTFLDAWV